MALPASAYAGDIGEALEFAQPVMTEENITQGLEQFIEEGAVMHHRFAQLLGVR